MNRKRFTKLMMATGVQRNEANAMARDIAIYGSYERLYRRKTYGESIGTALKSVGEAFIRAYGVLGRLTRAALKAQAEAERFAAVKAQYEADQREMIRKAYER